MLQAWGIQTDRISPSDNIIDVLFNAIRKSEIIIQEGDVIVITSKIVSIVQGHIHIMNEIDPTDHAKELAEQTLLTPEFCQLVIDSSFDQILGVVQGAILTRTEYGLSANAGVDQSNCPIGTALTIPSELYNIADELRNQIEMAINVRIGLIISDSRTNPLRVGSSGIALAVSGFNPVVDDRGTPDLFGKTLSITRRALADNICSAALIEMGETNESMPFAIVKGANIELCDRNMSLAMNIEAESCLYYGPFLKLMNFQNNDTKNSKK